MAFLPQIVESELNDFVRAMARKTSPDLTNVIEVSHPFLDQLRKVGGVKFENPGQGPVRDIQYASVRRVKKLSRTKKTGEREKAGSQTTTTAQYNWIMYMATMYVDKFTFHNTMGGDAQLSYLKERQDERDRELHKQLVEDIWNGDTVGTTPVWGLKDAIQFVPTADPDRGAVGGISVTDVPTWKNYASNFNGPYATYVNGAQTLTFLDSGTSSLGTLYRNCCNNDDQKNEKGCPKLMPSNEAMIRYCEGLSRAGLLRQDGNETRDFGIEGFRYKKAIIYWDNDCPVDPNDNSRAVSFLINPYSFEVIFAKGLERMVGPQVIEQSDGSYTWDITSQASIAVKDRRRNGVFYGVTETSAS